MNRAGRATAEQQAHFFVKLQHLLTEGEFVSTYKFALLLALTRWAVENPDHDEAVPLDAAALAPHFVRLYWSHTRPFGAGTEVVTADDAADEWRYILVQDRGRQRPRVLKLVLAAQQAGHGDLGDLPVVRRDQLLAKVKASIRAMPLWKLHALAGGREMQFLYRRGGDANTLLFEPGIVGCLAEFSGLIEHIVRSAWLRFVVRCNARLVGKAAQVEDFLFPDGRGRLDALRPVLEQVQGRTCFYCDRDLRQDVAVDHFLSWSRYPRDLGHNFVLAHARCNGQKRDHLPSVEHLGRWRQRNEDGGRQLAAAFDAAGLPHDWPTLCRVAQSLYRSAANAGAGVWRVGSGLVPLADDWRRILGVA